MMMVVVVVVVVVVHLLVDRDMHGHGDMLHNGDMLDDWHMHLLNVMVVVGVHFVGNMDHDVLTGEGRGEGDC